MKKSCKTKKSILIILSLIMIFVICSFNYSTQETDEIKIMVDGLLLETDQPPLMVNDRVLVPLRSIFNALYAEVEWIGETQTVVATKRFQTISFSIGSNEMYLNGEAILLDSPAILVNDRTFVPVRAVSEGFGAGVSWNGETKTVSITSTQQEHYISDHYITEIIKTDDEQCELLKISISYPQIRNDENNPYIDQLNEILKTEAQNVFKNSKEEYVPNVKEFYNEVVINEPEIFSYNLPYEVTLKFDITYDKNDLISIVNMYTTWTGGAHPNSTKTSVTYDLQNSKELVLTDIFNKTQDEINSMVMEKFTTLMNENPDAYFEDANTTIKEEIENVGFYLNENGVTFYFDPYIITPYAAGFPSITLSFYEEVGFFDRFITEQQ